MLILFLLCAIFFGSLNCGVLSPCPLTVNRKSALLGMEIAMRAHCNTTLPKNIQSHFWKHSHWNLSFSLFPLSFFFSPPQPRLQDYLNQSALFYYAMQLWKSPAPAKENKSFCEVRCPTSPCDSGPCSCSQGRVEQTAPCSWAPEDAERKGNFNPVFFWFLAPVRFIWS